MRLTVQCDRLQTTERADLAQRLLDHDEPNRWKTAKPVLWHSVHCVYLQVSMAVWCVADRTGKGNRRCESVSSALQIIPGGEACWGCQPSTLTTHFGIGVLAGGPDFVSGIHRRP